MPIGSLKDLYFDELGDLYDAENQIVRLLPRLAEAAHAPELREALVRHCDESRLHLERLQLIFTHWGERPGLHRCMGTAGIVQEADDRVNRGATPDATDAAIIGAAQRLEHYELAAYGCARTYARRLNRDDEARLLQETLDDERRADRHLTEIAEAHVNDDARGEADAEPSPRHRLRYADAQPAEGRRASLRGLRVGNDAGEDLGSVAGLILDDADRPRYIVVDSGGLFGRRYLLPVEHVRLDASRRMLRTPLDRAVARRYPEFDRDDFEAMSIDRLSGYESRLLAFFPGETTQPSAGADASSAKEPAEWLMTGVWLTLPPEQAERLDESARSFANEFAPDRLETPVADGPFSIERAVAEARPPDNGERLVAREDDRPAAKSEDDAPTPPHGDELRPRR